MGENILHAVPSTSLAKWKFFINFEALKRTEKIKKLKKGGGASPSTLYTLFECWAIIRLLGAILEDHRR
jgi:hypothetical protein